MPTGFLLFLEDGSRPDPRLRDNTVVNLDTQKEPDQRHGRSDPFFC